MNQLPNNRDLERQLVGQSLVDGKLVSTELTPADFYDTTWRDCWAAISDLDATGKEIEAFAVAEIVRKKNPDIPISVIASAATGLVFSHDPSKWARQLKNLAVRRFLMRQLSAQIEYLENSDDVGECMNRLEDRFDRIRTNLDSKEDRFVAFEQIVEQEILPALDDLQQGRTNKIATGFDVIDKAIGGGFSISDVVIFAGLPGGGKSALVLQIAHQIASRGIGVAFLSGEMTNRENGLRLLSQVAGFINLNSAVFLRSDDRQFLNQWAEAIRHLPLYFDHRTSDLQTLSAHLRSLVRQKDIKVLVIDYIQLLKLEKVDRRTRHERITEASQEVKRIANELQICVIEVAQFNRIGAKSGKPTMHDLEASGQLEKDTSLIFIIDRGEDDREAITLRIVKGRNTGQCELYGRFTGATLRFEFT
jgi:replicative DNA helicase